jgi:hypothetical protein
MVHWRFWIESIMDWQRLETINYSGQAEADSGVEMKTPV